MVTIGFPKACKKGEKRLAILPMHLDKVKNTSSLYFEEGYASDYGINDSIYLKNGCKIVSRSEVLKQDIICDPKIGEANYLENLKDDSTIWGWVHAVQNPKLAKLLVEKKITAYAWEDMYEAGRHSFYQNNVLAGKASVLHALIHYGSIGRKIKAAILGRGNVATGACEILSMLGSDVTVYGRDEEELFQKELNNYDVLINGILWDVNRKDHIIYKEDIKSMKDNTLIIDISCDENGAIETSHATSIDNPIYVKYGVLHYAVDNTPSLLYRDASVVISEVVSTFIDQIIEHPNNQVLSDSCIISKGKIKDHRIIDYQKLHPDK